MLYIVSTPIGNLEDITYRAVRVLSECDLILCEDTRHSKILLDRYEIKKPLKSYHKFNEKESAEQICDMLSEGKNIALISDAGTPLISDPGSELVAALLARKLPFTAIPGASAVIAALTLSGFSLSSFTFFGFLPRDRSRKEFLSRVKESFGTLVFYIAPHAYKEDIADLYKTLGKRRAVVMNELTKMFEKRIEIELSESEEKEIKGEIVLVVDNERLSQSDGFLSLTPMEHLLGYINSGMEKSEAIKRVAKERGVPKNEIYQLLLNKND